MKKVTILIFSFILIFSSSSLLKGVEINVTEGKIEPLPLAVTKFNYLNKNEESYSTQITNIISNNLEDTGLFKVLSSESYLQSENEVFFQPLFADWRLIDANFLVSGKIKIENNVLEINFKLWDVYQEKLVINKNISGITKSDWRISSHIISNLIYEKITGEKGYFDTKLVYVAEEGMQEKKNKKTGYYGL